eukprot:6185983-Pleurochrysis_carterae.AAC.5
MQNHDESADTLREIRVYAPVYDFVLAVQVFNASEQRGGDVREEGFGQAAAVARDAVGEGAAVHVLEHQVHRAVG